MAWPVRGQKAPNYWDDDVKAYIDDADALLATGAELQAHLDDTTGAHAASAISYAGASGLVADDVEEALDELDAEKAPLASPALTGNPTAPTASPGDSDTTIATTAFVQAAADARVEDAIVDGITDVAPSQNAVRDALDTLEADLTADLADKAPLASPVFTGNPTAPTPAPGDNDTTIPTTEWVQDEIAGIVGGTPSAATVTFTPDGNIAATNVQAAIVEVRNESVQDGDAAGGVLAGTYPDPSFAVDMATQAELEAHVNDTIDAHNASAISYEGSAGLSADNVETALDELDLEKAPLASPSFTGDPQAPTPSPGDNNESIATTAFVTAALAVNLPAGVVVPFADDVVPTGWLLCDGQAVSRSTYATLFGLIGTTYGTGDGSTTFNVPNLKGKTVFGRDSGQTEFDVLGETSGAKTHTHTLSSAGWARTYVNGTSGDFEMDFVGTAGWTSDRAALGGTVGSGGNSNPGGAVLDGTTDASTAATSLPPYMVLNYLIKT